MASQLVRHNVVPTLRDLRLPQRICRLDLCYPSLLGDLVRSIVPHPGKAIESRPVIVGSSPRDCRISRTQIVLQSGFGLTPQRLDMDGIISQLPSPTHALLAYACCVIEPGRGIDTLAGACPVVFETLLCVAESLRVSDEGE